MTHESAAHHDQSITGQQICILWHAPGTAPASALLGALHNKGMKITLADNEHTVFAVACRCDGVAKRTVIVLDGRESLSGVDRVLSALERFGPGVICWAYQQGANPPMIPVVQHVKEAPASGPQGGGGVAGVSPAASVSASPRLAKPRAGAPTPLRLVGEHDPSSRRNGSGEVPVQGARVRQPLNAREVLDADELDALLAGEMGDRPRGK